MYVDEGLSTMSLFVREDLYTCELQYYYYGIHCTLAMFIN